MVGEDKQDQEDNNNYMGQVPSDALFKKIMEDVVAAREFLECYLPDNFKQLVDLTKITIEKESFVENDLKRSLSDIVYSIQTIDDQKAYVYVLIENQSSCDYWIAFRLWKYMLLLSERHKNTNTKNAKLPLIAPIVFYNGQKKYDAPLNLWELYSNPLMAKSLMTEDYRLVDLQSMDDKEIKKHNHLGMIEYFMKHIHTRDMLKLWAKFLNEYREAILIDAKRGYIYIKHLLWYSDARVPEEKQQELNELIIKNLSEKDGEDIMRSIAQKYIEEGETIGIEKERNKTAINMLKSNFDIKIISQVTGLSPLDITKLKAKL